MHSEFHGANAHVAYVDLLRILKDAQIAELRGQPAMTGGLQQRPDELARAHVSARNAGPKWRHRLDATLTRMPEVREKLNQLT